MATPFGLSLSKALGHSWFDKLITAADLSIGLGDVEILTIPIKRINVNRGRNR